MAAGPQPPLWLSFQLSQLVDAGRRGAAGSSSELSHGAVHGEHDLGPGHRAPVVRVSCEAKMRPGLARSLTSTGRRGGCGVGVGPSTRTRLPAGRSRPAASVDLDGRQRLAVGRRVEGQADAVDEMVEALSDAERVRPHRAGADAPPTRMSADEERAASSAGARGIVGALAHVARPASMMAQPSRADARGAPTLRGHGPSAGGAGRVIARVRELVDDHRPARRASCSRR